MNSFNLSEAFGEVSEQFVAEELDAGAMIPQEELITEPSGREHIMMTENIEKKSRSLWLRGGIAAAIVGVLIAGNLAVIYGLGRIGKNSSSVDTSTSSTEETTDTTAGTKQTETTSTTLKKRKVEVPNFTDKSYDEALKLAESCGICLSKEYVHDGWASAEMVVSQNITASSTVDEGSTIQVCVSDGIPYNKLNFELGENGYRVVECVDKGCYDLTIPSRYKGKPVTEIVDGAFCDCRMDYVKIPDSVTKIGESVFQDFPEMTLYGNSDTYAESYAKQHQILFHDLAFHHSESNYRVIDHSIYRVEDNKKLFTIENPQQYLGQSPVDADSVTVEITDITDAGDNWFFFSVHIYDPLCWSGLMNTGLTNQEDLCFWYNEKSSKLEYAGNNAEDMKIVNDEYNKYVGSYLGSYYLVYPDPDGGAVYAANFTFIVRFPVPGNGRVSAYSKENVDDINWFIPRKGGKVLTTTKRGLIEVNMLNHKEHLLTDRFKPYEIVSSDNRILCLEEVSLKKTRLLEYFPESNRFQTVCTLNNSGYSFDGCTDEEAYVFFASEDDYPPTIYTVSLKDGTIT